MICDIFKLFFCITMSRWFCPMRASMCFSLSSSSSYDPPYTINHICILYEKAFLWFGVLFRNNISWSAHYYFISLKAYIIKYGNYYSGLKVQLQHICTKYIFHDFEFNYKLRLIKVMWITVIRYLFEFQDISCQIPSKHSWQHHS